MSMISTLCDNVQSNDTAMLFSHSNREMMKKRIPNMVITVGQILVGVSGNAFVIHIYRKNSSLRSRLFYFIPWLALFDIHAIITIGTFSILQDIFSICFPSLFLCQSMWFGVIFCTSSGASCLLLIAFQRYCYVFQKPVLTRKWHRLFIIISLHISVFIAIPVFFIVDLRTMSVGGVIREVCGDTLYEEKLIYKYSYLHSLFFLAFLLIVVITILYVRIGLKTFKMMCPKEKQRHPSSFRKAGLKYTLMYVSVFVVYIVAYIPSNALSLLPDETRTKVYHAMDENNSKHIALLVVQRMLIFSHVLNPFIIYLFHARFRREMGKYFSQCQIRREQCCSCTELLRFNRLSFI